LREEIIAALRETLKNEEKISVVYLFGSYARGANTPLSDVDIAVLLSETPKNLLEYLLVHDYSSINLNLVYEFLQTKLSDFEDFMKHIAKWLGKT